MSSLVLELQRESYEHAVSTSDLLRKAYVVAKKLKIKEFECWINLELNGYSNKDDIIPEYRKLTGIIKAFNPYRGWIPVMMDNDSMYDYYSNRNTGQSIVELESLSCKEGDLYIPYPQSVMEKFSRNVGLRMEYCLFISSAQIEKIIETVRNIVLNWSLKLEEDGIVGEGMSFSDKEKAVATEKGYTVNHFHGNVNNSQIQQNTINSTQNMTNETIDNDKTLELVNLIKENLDKIELAVEKKAEIEAEVNTIKSQLDSPKPKHVIIKESLSTIRNVLEGATGSIIASGLLYELGLFLK